MASRVALGVVDDARARQRRRRLATVAVAAAIATVLAVLGPRALGGRPTPTPPSRAAAIAVTACVRPPATTVPPPSQSLRSILGVLRQPRAPADALPPAVDLSPPAAAFSPDYVRLARVVSGRSYYLVPARFAGCGTHVVHPYDSMMFVCVLRADRRVLEVALVGAGVAASTHIAQAGMFLVGGSCLRTGNTTLIAGVVPDRVASVTLRYPASTLTLTPVNNVIAAPVPDPGGPLWRPLTMTWRSADGTAIKRLHGRL